MYDQNDQAYYIKVLHTDRLDYGWRVKELSLYKDANCRSSSSYNSIKLQNSAIYTGPEGRANYPGKAANTALFDGNTKTEWWSHCYDCPKNSAYVMVNVKIPAGQPCKVHGMKLFQDPDYASSKVNVVAGTGAGGSGVWTYKSETFPAQGCTDGGFFDKNGAGCSAYVNGGWCNGKAGEYGSGWKQGEDSTIPANANADGIDAWEGCCACGGCCVDFGAGRLNIFGSYAPSLMHAFKHCAMQASAN